MSQLEDAYLYVKKDSSLQNVNLYSNREDCVTDSQPWSVAYKNTPAYITLTGDTETNVYKSYGTPLSINKDDNIFWVCTQPVENYTVTINVTPQWADIYVEVTDPDGNVIFYEEEETLSIEVKKGSVVGWEVSAEGYVTQSGKETVNSNIVIDISLEEETIVEIEDFYYDDISSAGGSVLPHIKVTEGAELSYEIMYDTSVEINGTGEVSADSLGSEIKERSVIARVIVTASLNSIEASAETEVYQQENEIIAISDEYYYCNGHFLDTDTAASNRIEIVDWAGGNIKLDFYVEAICIFTSGLISGSHMRVPDGIYTVQVLSFDIFDYRCTFDEGTMTLSVERNSEEEEKDLIYIEVEFCNSLSGGIASRNMDFYQGAVYYLEQGEGKLPAYVGDYDLVDYGIVRTNADYIRIEIDASDLPDWLSIIRGMEGVSDSVQVDANLEEERSLIVNVEGYFPDGDVEGASIEIIQEGI